MQASQLQLLGLCKQRDLQTEPTETDREKPLRICTDFVRYANNKTTSYSCQIFSTKLDKIISHKELVNDKIGKYDSLICFNRSNYRHILDPNFLDFGCCSLFILITVRYIKLLALLNGRTKKSMPEDEEVGRDVAAQPS